MRSMRSKTLTVGDSNTFLSTCDEVEIFDYLKEEDVKPTHIVHPRWRMLVTCIFFFLASCFFILCLVIVPWLR